MQVRLRRGLKLPRSVQSSMRFARFKVISLADSCTTLRVTALLRSMTFGSRGSMHCGKGYSQLSIINYKL